MIESSFCIKCHRPYAMEEIGICDSCLKDIEWMLKDPKNLHEQDPKFEKMVDELIKDVDIHNHDGSMLVCCGSSHAVAMMDMVMRQTSIAAGSGLLVCDVPLPTSKFSEICKGYQIPEVIAPIRIFSDPSPSWSAKKDNRPYKEKQAERWANSWKWKGKRSTN